VPASLRLRLLDRLVNPFARAILRSPLHRLLSASLLLLSYAPRAGGGERTIPVMYAEREGAMIVFAGSPAEKRWWRRLRGGAAVRLRIRGAERTGLAEAVTDDPQAIAEGLSA